MAPVQKGDYQAIGKSRGGLTTKIAVIVDALGNLIRFVLLPGLRHDITSFDALMAGIYCYVFGSAVWSPSTSFNSIMLRASNTSPTRYEAASLP